MKTTPIQTQSRDSASATKVSALARRSTEPRAAVHALLQSPGRPMDPVTRTEMESRFGYDLSSVRVHSGSDAARSAEMLGANAYTVGRHVAFGEGRHAPHTSDGRRLIAHELTHVIQQAHGPVAGTLRGDGLAISSPNDSFERAADLHAATNEPLTSATGRTLRNLPLSSYEAIHVPVQRDKQSLLEIVDTSLSAVEHSLNIRDSLSGKSKDKESNADGYDQVGSGSDTFKVSSDGFPGLIRIKGGDTASKDLTPSEISILELQAGDNKAYFKLKLTKKSNILSYATYTAELLEPEREGYDEKAVATASVHLKLEDSHVKVHGQNSLGKKHQGFGGDISFFPTFSPVEPVGATATPTQTSKMGTVRAMGPIMGSQVLTVSVT